MIINDLVVFNGGSNDTVTKYTDKGGTTIRLLSAKEFKTSRGVKGNEATKLYNTYLREQGRASTAGLAAAMSTGKLLVTRVSGTKNGCTVGFKYADKLKGEEVSTEEREILELLKSKGLSVEEIKELVK